MVCRFPRTASRCAAVPSAHPLDLTRLGRALLASPASGTTPKRPWHSRFSDRAVCRAFGLIRAAETPAGSARVLVLANRSTFAPNGVVYHAYTTLITFFGDTVVRPYPILSARPSRAPRSGARQDRSSSQFPLASAPRHPAATHDCGASLPQMIHAGPSRSRRWSVGMKVSRRTSRESPRRSDCSPSQRSSPLIAIAEYHGNPYRNATTTPPARVLGRNNVSYCRTCWVAFFSSRDAAFVRRRRHTVSRDILLELFARARKVGPSGAELTTPGERVGPSVAARLDSVGVRGRNVFVPPALSVRAHAFVTQVVVPLSRS